MSSFLSKVLRFIEKHPILSICCIWLVMTLPGLGNGYLWGRDENWYASCALNMVLSGDWIIPAVGERVFLEKPPWAYWSMAALIKLFGHNEFAVRLPSVIYGLGTLLVIYGWMKTQVEKLQALSAVLIVLSAPLFCLVFRAALTDPPLVMFMFLGLWAFWNLYHEEHSSALMHTWAAVGGFAVGAAVLSKGPMGLLPGFTALIYLLIRRSFLPFIRKANFSLVTGLIVLVIVVSPWYVAIFQSKGQAFFQEFIIDHNLGRATDPMQGHSGPFFYYLPVILFGLCPWSLFAGRCWKRRKSWSELEILMVVWIVVVFILFSVLSTKLYHYMAPIIPAFGILLSRDVREFFEEDWIKGWIFRPAFVFMMLVLVLILTAGSFLFYLHVNSAAVGLLLIFILLLSAIIGALLSKNLGIQKTILAGFLPVLFLSLQLLVLPQLKETQILQRIAIDTVSKEQSDSKMIVFAFYEPAFFFYTAQDIDSMKEEELQAFLATFDGDVQVICRTKHIDNVLRQVSDRYESSVTEYQAVPNAPEWFREKQEDEQKFYLQRIELTLNR